MLQDSSILATAQISVLQEDPEGASGGHQGPGGSHLQHMSGGAEQRQTKQGEISAQQELSASSKLDPPRVVDPFS